MNEITGEAHALKEMFNDNYDYYIPSYQRPYSWTNENAGELFYDLYRSFEKDKDAAYFLGSIVLIKKDKVPKSDVVDGQQRLTTLTMLISAISYSLLEKNQTNRSELCKKYLQAAANEAENINCQPRIHLREQDQDFFEEYIQNVRIDDLFTMDKKDKRINSEAKEHIQENCLLLYKNLNEKLNTGDEIFDFFKFMINKCYMVVVTTDSPESAFNIFSVMNDRGLNLLPIDIMKAEIIGKIDQRKQEYYTNKWEKLEEDATRNGFNEVFSHTRMIFAKSKAGANLLEEFRKYIVKEKSGEDIIDNILQPYADAYITLKESDYRSTKNAEEINDYLFWLNKIDNSDWMPPAIKFLSEHKNENEYVLWFMKKLERISAFLYITGKTINQRIEKYKKLLEEMENNPEHCLEKPLKSIELKDDEKKEFIEALDGEIYKFTSKKRSFVMSRLNSFVGDGAISANGSSKKFTIEHVLPQTVSSGSEWESLWPDVDMREEWINKAANLVILTQGTNSESGNLDFKMKKEKYVKGKNGTITYPLTTQVLYEEEWSPTIVKNRQERLLKIFTEHWELQYNDNTKKEKIESGDYNFYYLRGDSGADADGYYSPNEKFVVKKGSKINSRTSKGFEISYKNAFNMRSKLCEDGTIVDDTFEVDKEFDNASLAASVVLGTIVDGNKRWKDKDGKSFKDRENKSDN